MSGKKNCPPWILFFQNINCTHIKKNKSQFKEEKINNKFTETQQRRNQGNQQEAWAIRIGTVGPVHESEPLIGRKIQCPKQIRIFMVKGDYFCIEHVIEKIMRKKRVGDDYNQTGH